MSGIRNSSGLAFRILLCLLGLALAFPLLALILFAIKLPITIFGALYLAAGLLVAFGFISAPFLPRYYPLPVLAGLTGFLLTVGARLILFNQYSTTEIKMITLPKASTARWTSYLVDEQDGIIFGEAFFHLLGGDSSVEHEGLTADLYSDYSAMRATQKVFPSPVVDTYLNLQQPNAFDAVVIEPEENRHPDIGVIFLHGFMGNVTAQCWEIAQAVDRFGAVTVCPSTEWKGEWWQPRGESILRASVAYLRERGVEKIYLGGFSNGGFGISRMVTRLRDIDGLSGLFFIDGIYGGEEIKSMGLPVLVIQGSQDDRMPAAEARLVTQAIGDLATYVELDSDHFVIMKLPVAVQDALAAWLADQDSGK